MRINDAGANAFADYRMLYFAAVVGCAVRLFHLGGQSVWGDEFLTLRYSAVGSSLAEVSSNLWHRALHAPLYFLVVHCWYQLGYSEFMLRLPSAVFGIAAIPVGYALASRLFDRKVGGITAFVLALSPVHIWYSQEARMYSLQILLGLASTLFFVRVWQNHRAVDMAAYALFTAMGLFTHITTLFLMAAQGLFIIGASARKWKTFVTWIGLQVAVVLACAPWLLNVLERNKPASGALRIGYERASSIWDVGYGFYTFAVGFSLGPSVAELHEGRTLQAITGHWPAVVLPAAVFGWLAVLGLAHAHRVNRWAFWLVVALLTVPTALAVSAALLPGVPLNPRYMLVGVIPYWIVIPLGIRVCVSFRPLYVLPASVVLITGFSLYNHYFEPAYAKQDVRSAVAVINRQARPGDLVVISSIELGGPFIYYFRRHDVPYVGYPECPGLVDPDSLSPDMAQVLRDKRRVWLVLGRTWSSDPRGIIRAHFDARYELIARKQLSGVYLGCYSLD